MANDKTDSIDSFLKGILNLIPENPADLTDDAYNQFQKMTRLENTDIPIERVKFARTLVM